MMDVLDKVEVLSQAAQYDLCGACGKDASRQRSPLGRWIYPATLPDGRGVLLLKILMTNACKNDCLYCANRCSKSFSRLSFEPEELARLFIGLYRRRKVQGLFLSSAVSDGTSSTMERMVKAAEIIRTYYKFPGYIHLKILPGAEFSCVEQAVRLANRVSVNLEAPNKEKLEKIAPGKDFESDLILRMKWASKLASDRGSRKIGQTTQFVVGAAQESDREILTTTDFLYRKVNLARAYFSAFQPVKDTPLEVLPATPPLREHRLYQTDFLFRRYGFKLNEIVFDSKGNLSLKTDPKMVWAYSHPEFFPVEVNKATKEELLRVPGIGPISAARIVKSRTRNRFCTLQELSKTGVVTKRAASFVLINGRRGRRSSIPVQLSLLSSC